MIKGPLVNLTDAAKLARDILGYAERFGVAAELHNGAITAADVELLARAVLQLVDQSKGWDTIAESRAIKIKELEILLEAERTTTRNVARDIAEARRTAECARAGWEAWKKVATPEQLLLAAAARHRAEGSEESEWALHEAIDKAVP